MNPPSEDRESVIAIDPGPSKSALVEWNGELIGVTRYLPNSDLLTLLKNCRVNRDHCAIEMIASYGMAVGAEVFETCVWIGRFMEVYGVERVTRVPRNTIKNHLCHSSRANDSNIRQAIIDRFGGKDKAIGRKHTPGPLYCLSGDLWAAFAVALWYKDTH